MVSVWVLMTAVGSIRLLRAAVDWYGRIKYERVRAETVTVTLRSMRAETILQEGRADGTYLSVRQAALDEQVNGSEAAASRECEAC